MGCILYDMACLQKTFEGSNLPALVNKNYLKLQKKYKIATKNYQVNKIMKGQFAPIRGNYSPLFKQLVREDKSVRLKFCICQTRPK